MSEAINFKKTLVAAAVTAMAGGAIAAELGSLMVFSAVGEPLEAELTIRDVDPTADQLMVRLAPASTYRRVGKEVALSLNDISLTLLRKDPYTVKIKGQQAVDAAQFPLIVELSDAGKISAKLYEVRLQNRTASTAPRQEKVEKSSTQTEIASAAAKQPAVEPAVKTAPVSSDSSVVPSAVVPSSKTAAAAAPAPAPAVRETPRSASVPAADQKPMRAAAKPESGVSAGASVKLPLNPADYDLDKPLLVRNGMTMWSIATLYRPRYPEASMDQILVAFVRANPNAYERGRVNGVRVGSRLHAPLADEVASVPLDEAWALVRVAPNADARKAPSKKVLQRAHARMQKEAPALWRKWKAENPQPKPVVKPAVAAETKPLPKAEPAALKHENKPAAPAVDPLAATIAKADAEHDAKLQVEATPAPQSSEPQVSPEPAATETQAAAEPTPVPEMPAVQDKPEESSGGFWGVIVGILVVLGGAAGGLWYWMKQKGAKRRREEENMGVVRFRKAEAANPEQLQGTQEMLERRLESERATQRMQQAEQQNGARIEPALGEIAQQSAAQPSPFNVATAYVGEEAQTTPAEPGVAPTAETLSGKLITARTYIGVGAYAEAERVLHEVLLAGNEQQRRQANELLAQVEQARGGQQ